MEKQERKPNRNGEFLLDVLPDKKRRGFWYIYDISHFFPHWNCRERTNYLNRVTQIIEGNKHKIFIIDWHNSLSKEQARKLASEWFLGNTTEHRLD